MNIVNSQRNVWRLRRRPVGEIAEGDLTYDTEALPALAEGQFHLQTLYLSLDPTNRVWMSDMRQYMPPVKIGEAMRGIVVGRVVASRKSGVREGDLMMGIGEWADHIVTNGAALSPVKLPPGVPLARAFGVFALVGPTAYIGLMDIGKPKPGETLVVSAASGGVGQIVGQIGKIKGCHVIGIAGGAEKCRYIVDELGFDAAIDYKNENVGERLDALAPKGIDINFEQVGGPIMEAVMSRMNLFGRMALCGMVSGYNDDKGASGPRTWPLILMQRLTVRGFIAFDSRALVAEAIEALGGWMAEGRVKTKQDVRKGLDSAVENLKDLLRGGNFGKLMIEVDPQAASL
jgi:NADPH-dependent curcumin reductase CurA